MSSEHDQSDQLPSTIRVQRDANDVALVTP